MLQRSYDLQELTRMLQNQNNPKTMDYYFLKFMNVDSSVGYLTISGTFIFNITSQNTALSAAFKLLTSYSQELKTNKNKFCFVLDVFKHHKLPRSRSFKLRGLLTRNVHVNKKTEIGVIGKHEEKNMLLYFRTNYQKK